MAIAKFTPKLTASVTYRDGKHAHAKVVTLATIRLHDDIVVAWAELGGRFTEAQALTEFKRLPERFKKHSGWEAYSELKQAGLI